MDTLLTLLSEVNHPRSTPPHPPRLAVIAGPHAASGAMLQLAAHLALRGPLRVLDGGNRFNAYHVARALRHLKASDPTPALARIQVARAFTCYQMAALINGETSFDKTSFGEADARTPTSPPAETSFRATPDAFPLLILDLLDTFYDESAPLPERRRLAQGCLARLRQSSQQSVIVISLRPPPPPLADPTGLFELVQAAADLLLFSEMNFA